MFDAHMGKLGLKFELHKKKDEPKYSENCLHLHINGFIPVRVYIHMFTLEPLNLRRRGLQMSAADKNSYHKHMIFIYRIKVTAFKYIMIFF